MTKVFIDDIEYVPKSSQPPIPPPVPPIPPPIPPPPPSGGGTYSEQVKQAIKLDQPTRPGETEYGFHRDQINGGNEIGIGPNTTTYFLVDPLAVVGKVTQVRIGFIDFYTRDNLQINIHIIDRADNLIRSYYVGLSGNTFSPWSPRGGHRDEYRYLIEIRETKGQDIMYNVFWSAY